MRTTTGDGRRLRFLLTGGTGFLGGNLLRALIAHGAEVSVLKRRSSDLWRIADVQHLVRFSDLDDISVTEAVQASSPDVIVHCATNYGRDRERPTEVIAANLTLPLTLLQAAASARVPVFVNTDTILDKRVSYYSLSKRHFSEWLTLFAAEMTCVNVALEHFYGPLDDRSKFVTRIISDLLAETPRIELTPGQQKRDFIFIDDVVDAFLRILEFAFDAGPGFHRFEIGTNETVTIRDFVQLVKQLTGNRDTNLQFGALPYRENEVMESHVDTSQVSALGWRPHIRLDEGLQRTIDVERQRQAQ